FEQLDRLERARGQREDDKGQVEPPPLQVGEQLAVVLGLAELHLDPRPGRGELAQHRGQQPRADDLVRSSLPPSRSASSSPSSWVSLSCTSTRGQAAVNSRSTGGSSRAPTLW